MKFSARYRLTAREIFAIAIAFLLLVLGFWLGWCFDPAWLSRIGALVIVIGVIFAVTDLPVALEKRARAIAKITNALIFRSWLNQREDELRKTFTAAERAALGKHFQELNALDIDREASKPRKRFIVVETTIVCVGTLTNGFGEWVMKLIIGSLS